MNIQIIGTSWGEKVGFDGIVQSPLSNPRSLDEFDVNIIDLSCESLWYYKGNAPSCLNQSNDLVSVRQMVCNSVSADIIYVLPMSIALKYSALHDKYYSSLMIKDDLDSIRKNILNQVFYPELPPLSLLFENTRTEINDLEYEADFYFKNGLQEETKSKLSNKITTISLNERVLATTLNITSSKEKLINFVNFFYEDNEESQHPAWFSDVSFYDDSLQKDIIREREAEIARAKQAIDNARSRLAENEKYKSILHTNGADLVHVVFSILEQLLGCDLSEFEDKKNEDFLIRLDRCTLIGEIKGVTSNVKNDHIGQIEHHYQRYMDELEEKQTSEDVHQLLIIGPFRTKAPDEREPINDKQISLAKRNGCLIIETKTLLKLFERYLENSITSVQCIQLFCTRTGLLQITDIPQAPEEDIAAFMV